jgi:hypothetical protein
LKAPPSLTMGTLVLMRFCTPKLAATSKEIWRFFFSRISQFARKVTIFIFGNLKLESFPFTNEKLISISKLPPAFRSLISTFYKIFERLFSLLLFFTISRAIFIFNGLTDLKLKANKLTSFRLFFFSVF